MSALVKVQQVRGRPIPLRGNDIDTDRIIPARYLKAVTFDGLGQHAFYDERFDAAGQSQGPHPRRSALPGERARGSRSSTRTSAADRRASTRRRRCCAGASRRSSASRSPTSSSATASRSACPASRASEADVAALMAAVEEDPAHDLTVDLAGADRDLSRRDYPVDMPGRRRKQLLEGTWDGTRVLLDAGERIRADRGRACPTCAVSASSRGNSTAEARRRGEVETGSSAELSLQPRKFTIEKNSRASRAGGLRASASPR